MSITRNINEEDNAEQQQQQQQQNGGAGGAFKKIQVALRNAKSRTAAGSKNTTQAIKIQQIKMNLTSRKQKFGIEYMDLMGKEGSYVNALETCVAEAFADINELKDQLAMSQETIASNKERLVEKIAARKMGVTPPTSSSPTHTNTHQPPAADSVSPAVSSDEDTDEKWDNEESDVASTPANVSTADVPVSSDIDDTPATTIGEKEDLPFDEGEEDDDSISSTPPPPPASPPSTPPLNGRDSTNQKPFDKESVQVNQKPFDEESIREAVVDTRRVSFSDEEDEEMIEDATEVVATCNSETFAEAAAACGQAIGEVADNVGQAIDEAASQDSFSTSNSAATPNPEPTAPPCEKKLPPFEANVYGLD